MNNTNIVVSGSGTGSDPYVSNYHITAQSSGESWVLSAVLIVASVTAVGGFRLGYYFGQRKKKTSN
jgi:hypothetical protein